MSYGSSSYNNPPPWSRSSSSAHSSVSYQNVGSSMYSAKRPHSPVNYNSSYQSSSSKVKSSSGYVTKLYDSWGIIDNEIQFSFSACSKGIPKLKDYVNIETIHSPDTTYKWRAVKVILANNGRDYSNLRPVISSRTETEYRRLRALEKSRERSRERKYEEVERKRFKRDDKDDKIREFDKDTFKEREKIREFDRSPIRRSRSPFKRKLTRYSVKVPEDVLTLSEADIMTLRKRYPTLYIPSDFFSTRIRWCETFPLSKPFTLNRPCSFHIMHKECDSYKKNDAVVDPPDLDYSFSAKVMLMSVPRLEEIYRKSICTADDLSKEEEKNYVHISRLVQFLVGSRGKNEPLAIGGPWSPSLDGENPDKDPSVLIKTAIRTCKALTGIDLSVCFQWYRFMEVYYHRSESVHKGKTYPARLETVVFFLPEVWNCVPSCLEWDNVILNYKHVVKEKLKPKTRAEDSAPSQAAGSEPSEESDKEEDLVVIDKCEEKIEATHYSELDPPSMKVNDLKQELEARSLSVSGLKQHLVQRLELALRKERDLEEEEGKVKVTISSVSGSLKVVEVVKEDEAPPVDGESKEPKKDPADTKVAEVIDPAVLEKRYTLPEMPHIVVHPSKTAKGGKFECFTLSLACLLDYRPNENKEHSFELFLFAELFHEMLQRDFGFQIYKSLCEAPEKVKDEEKDPKKSDKEATKPSTPDKSGKSEDKEENTTKDEKIEKKPSDVKSVDDKSSESDAKKDRGKMTTKDPFLLLSYCFFDRTHCGYIFDKDLESLIFSLGLHLSRHQVKRLISKVAQRDAIHYRKLTDKGELDEDCPKPTITTENIVLGNKKYFPVFTDKKSRRTSPLNNSRISFDDSNKAIVCIDGAIVDVEKVTSNLKKSESLRLELENQLLKCKKDIDGFQESLKKSSDREKKLNEDYKTCRGRLTVVNKEKLSYSNKSRTFYKVLMNIKDQISTVEEKSEKTAAKSAAKSSEKVEEKPTSAGKKQSKDDNEGGEKSTTATPAEKEKESSPNESAKSASEKVEEKKLIENGAKSATENCDTSTKATEPEDTTATTDT